jgi:hypothetical protein
MNIDLIIEALEESLQMRCGNCRGPNDESCGGNCNIRDALTEARKMQEPCKGVHYGATLYCSVCGKKLEREIDTTWPRPGGEI